MGENEMDVLVCYGGGSGSGSGGRRLSWRWRGNTVEILSLFHSRPTHSFDYDYKMNSLWRGNGFIRRRVSCLLLTPGDITWHISQVVLPSSRHGRVSTASSNTAK